MTNDYSKFSNGTPTAEMNGTPLDLLNIFGQSKGLPFISNIDTFFSRWTTLGKLYDPRGFDVALANSPTNARAMRNDAFIESLLLERHAPLPVNPWAIIAEDDDYQDDADFATGLIEKLPDWAQFVAYLAEADWHGKYGSRLKWVWDTYKSQDVYIPRGHEPLHGDKIQFDWDGVPGVLIGTQGTDKYPDKAVFMSILGPCLKILEPSWRAEFIIHKHRVLDADYYFPQEGGRIHGMGLRSPAYWCWNLRNEVLAWIMQLMSRVGLTGILIFWYAAGSKDGKADAERASAQVNTQNTLVMAREESPTALRQESWGVQHIPINLSGVTALQALVDDYYQKQLERLIIGQGMSGGQDNDSGLGGSGRAKFAKSTKDNNTKYDLKVLAETLTTDLLNPILTINRPGLVGKLKFDFPLPDDDEKGKQEAVMFVLQAQLPVAVKDVYGAAGIRKPREGEKTIGGPQAQQPGQPGQQPQPGSEQPAQVAQPGAAQSQAIADPQRTQEQPDLKGHIADMMGQLQANDVILGYGEEEGQVRRFTIHPSSFVGDKGEQIRTDGGRIDIQNKDLKWSPRSQSVIDFVVDENKRNQGIGHDLLKEAIRRHANLGGQVSSLASLKVFHNNGFRNPDLGNTPFERHLKEFKDNGGSLYMAHKDDEGKPYVLPQQTEQPPSVNLSDLLTLIAYDFDESKIHRDGAGEFSSVGGGSSGSHFSRMLSCASEVPGAVRRKATQFIGNQYRKLEKKYGPRGAKLVMVGMVALTPIPLPGTSLIPIALAEAVKRTMSLFKKPEAVETTVPYADIPDHGIDAQSLAHAMRDGLWDFYAAMGEEPPEVTDEKILEVAKHLMDHGSKEERDPRNPLFDPSIAHEDVDNDGNPYPADIDAVEGYAGRYSVITYDDTAPATSQPQPARQPARLNQGARQAINHFHGRELPEEEMQSVAHSLGGGHHESRVVVLGEQEHESPHHSIELEAESPHHSGSLTLSGSPGKLQAYYGHIVMKPHAKFGTLAPKMLFEQLRALHSMGVRQVSTLAAGDAKEAAAGGFRGYDTWHKMGMDGPLLKEHISDLPPEFQTAKTLGELQKMPGGSEAWTKHGKNIKLSMDLQSEAAKPMVEMAQKMKRRNDRLIAAGKKPFVPEAPKPAELKPEESAVERERQLNHAVNAAVAGISRLRGVNSPNSPLIEEIYNRANQQGYNPETMEQRVIDFFGREFRQTPNASEASSEEIKKMFQRSIEVAFHPTAQIPFTESSAAPPTPIPTLQERDAARQRGIESAQSILPSLRASVEADPNRRGYNLDDIERRARELMEYDVSDWGHPEAVPPEHFQEAMQRAWNHAVQQADRQARENAVPIRRPWHHILKGRRVPYSDDLLLIHYNDYVAPQITSDDVASQKKKRAFAEVGKTIAAYPQGLPKHEHTRISSHLKELTGDEIQGMVKAHKGPDVSPSDPEAANKKKESWKVVAKAIAENPTGISKEHYNSLHPHIGNLTNEELVGLVKAHGIPTDEENQPQKPTEIPNNGPARTGIETIGTSSPEGSRRVAGEVSGSASAKLDRGRESENQPNGSQSSTRLPASLPEINRRLDRHEGFFRSKGHYQVADWLRELRDHVNEMGGEESLKALGEEQENNSKEQAQYLGIDTGSPLWASSGHFISGYLKRHGVMPVTEEELSEHKPVVSALADLDDRKKHAMDFVPVGPNYETKLHEAKDLPGLESSEDLGKVMGKPVTHITPHVMAKLNEKYGRNQWIVKTYDPDNAAAGFGIYFPQRATQIRRDAKNTIRAAKEQLKKYGFDLHRDEEGKVVGIKHHTGEIYSFSHNHYRNNIYGDARHWADQAATAAENEQGPQLPNNGKHFMAQPAFKVAGVSDADRAAGKTWEGNREGRVHLVTRNGKVEVIPHSTWIKGDPLPVVFEDEDTKSMAKAAQDAISKLPFESRNGQLYAPDIVKTPDGHRVVELNATTAGGGSGYLHDNQLIIDSYVSHLLGREPAHVQFIRNLLSKKAISDGGTTTGRNTNPEDIKGGAQGLEGGEESIPINDARRAAQIDPTQPRSGRAPEAFSEELRKNGIPELPETTGEEGHFHQPQEIRDQYNRQVLYAAKKSGDFVPPWKFERITKGSQNIGGQEHDVHEDADNDRFFKFTKGGHFGQNKDLAEYLERHRIANELWPESGYQFHGITQDVHGNPQSVMSMNRAEGTHPSWGEIDDWFRGNGFQPNADEEDLREDHRPEGEEFGWGSWYDPKTGLVIGDTHPGNFIKTASGKLVPIDVDILPGQPTHQLQSTDDFIPFANIHTRLEDATDGIAEPTHAQAKAGNWKMGHVNFQGLPLTIEVARGQERKGINKNGEEWSRTMPHAYGRIKRSVGADGEHIDVFIGPDPDSEIVYIVDQVKKDGSFDEHKNMLGFRTLAEAKQGYLDAYPSNWKGLGAITPVTIGQFKRWLQCDTSQPVENERRFADIIEYAEDQHPVVSLFDPAIVIHYDPTTGTASVSPPQTKAPTFTPTHDLSKRRADAVQKATEWLGSRLAGHHQEHLRQVKVQHSSSKHAGYEKGTATIRLTPKGGVKEALHEFGHHMETDPWTKDLVKEFEAKRFGNEKPTDFSTVVRRTGKGVMQLRNYGKTEMGRTDAMDRLFSDPLEAHYVGKTYPDGDTEILAKGLEKMYENPEEFGKIDPEYHALVSKILAGEGKPVDRIPEWKLPPKVTSNPFENDHPHVPMVRDPATGKLIRPQ